MRRVRDQHRNWLDLRYPLVFEVRKTRLDCVQLIRWTGWNCPIPHSACYLCPNLGDEEWADMKDNLPDDFEKACSSEDHLRIDDEHFWFHPSCRPLRTVDFHAQQSMFANQGCTWRCFT